MLSASDEGILGRQSGGGCVRVEGDHGGWCYAQDAPGCHGLRGSGMYPPVSSAPGGKGGSVEVCPGPGDFGSPALEGRRVSWLCEGGVLGAERGPFGGTWSQGQHGRTDCQMGHFTKDALLTTSSR